jgi:hypothetical protein
VEGVAMLLPLITIYKGIIVNESKLALQQNIGARHKFMHGRIQDTHDFQNTGDF